MSNVNDLGNPNVGASTFDGGNYANWGATSTVTLVANNGQINIPFTGGYMVTYGANPLSNLANSSVVTQYNGYNTNYGSSVILNTQTTLTDLDPVAPHPKNQTIFYKMAGFNPNTQQLENWIISEEIVTRPELFDPTRSPPNVDFGTFTTPPSGHNLVNIKIVARWIQ